MASKRRLRRNACGSKVKYPSHECAVLAAHIVGRKRGVKQSAYKCTFCGLWHIGKALHTLKIIVGREIDQSRIRH